MLPSAAGEGEHTDATEISSIESVISIKDYLSQKEEQPDLDGQANVTDESSEVKLQTT